MISLKKSMGKILKLIYLIIATRKSSVKELLQIEHIAGAWQVVKDKGEETKGSKTDVSNVDEDVELTHGVHRRTRC